MGNVMQKLSRAGLVLMLIGVGLLVVSLGDTITSFKEAKSFEEILENGAAPGDHVSGQVLFLMDAFANEQTWTENTKTGSTTPKKTSAQYYVLPCGEDWVGLRVGSQSISTANKLVDETYDSLMGGDAPTAELSMDARVAVMEKDLAELFRDDLKEYYGYTDDDIAAMGTILMVEGRAFGTIRAFCGAGAAALLIGLAMLVLHWRKVSEQIRAAQAAAPGPDLD